jgi:hypothetical protein
MTRVSSVKNNIKTFKTTKRTLLFFYIYVIFSGPCILIHLFNKNQENALFFLNLF